MLWTVLAQSACSCQRSFARPDWVRAPVLHAWHAAIPVAAAAIGWASLAPLPPPPAGPAAPPGAEKVQLAQIQGLEKVIKLAEMNARDDAQRERLKKLSEEAKKRQVEVQILETYWT